MAGPVLNSQRAVAMSVYVVRAFVRMREELLGRARLEKRLAEIEPTLIGHDAALRPVPKNQTATHPAARQPEARNGISRKGPAVGGFLHFTSFPRFLS